MKRAADAARARGVDPKDDPTVQQIRLTPTDSFGYEQQQELLEWQRQQVQREEAKAIEAVSKYADDKGLINVTAAIQAGLNQRTIDMALGKNTYAEARRAQTEATVKGRKFTGYQYTTDDGQTVTIHPSAIEQGHAPTFKDYKAQREAQINSDLDVLAPYEMADDTYDVWTAVEDGIDKSVIDRQFGKGTYENIKADVGTPQTTKLLDTVTDPATGKEYDLQYMLDNYAPNVGIPHKDYGQINWDVFRMDQATYRVAILMDETKTGGHMSRESAISQISETGNEYERQAMRAYLEGERNLTDKLIEIGIKPKDATYLATEFSPEVAAQTANVYTVATTNKWAEENAPKNMAETLANMPTESIKKRFLDKPDEQAIINGIRMASENMTIAEARRAYYQLREDVTGKPSYPSWYPDKQEFNEILEALSEDEYNQFIEGFRGKLVARETKPIEYFIPIIGTRRTIKERGWGSGWSILSIIGDVAILGAPAFKAGQQSVNLLKVPLNNIKNTKVFTNVRVVGGRILADQRGSLAAPKRAPWAPKKTTKPLTRTIGPKDLGMSEKEFKRLVKLKVSEDVKAPPKQPSEALRKSLKRAEESYRSEQRIRKAQEQWAHRGKPKAKPEDKPGPYSNLPAGDPRKAKVWPKPGPKKALPKVKETEKPGTTIKAPKQPFMGLPPLAKVITSQTIIGLTTPQLTRIIPGLSTKTKTQVKELQKLYPDLTVEELLELIDQQKSSTDVSLAQLASEQSKPGTSTKTSTQTQTKTKTGTKTKTTTALETAPDQEIKTKLAPATETMAATETVTKPATETRTKTQIKTTTPKIVPIPTPTPSTYKPPIPEPGESRYTPPRTGETKPGTREETTKDKRRPKPVPHPSERDISNLDKSERRNVAAWRQGLFYKIVNLVTGEYWTLKPEEKPEWVPVIEGDDSAYKSYRVKGGKDFAAYNMPMGAVNVRVGPGGLKFSERKHQKPGLVVGKR